MFIYKSNFLAHFDEDGNETEWWSPRRVTSAHIRLQSGEPVKRAFVLQVKQRAIAACSSLAAGRPYHARWLFGRWDWKELPNGRRQAVGRVLCALARLPGSPFIAVKQGQKNRYVLTRTSQLGTPPTVSARDIRIAPSQI